MRFYRKKNIYKRKHFIINILYIILLLLFWHCYWRKIGHCLFYEPDYYLHHPLEIILPFSFKNGSFTLTGYQGLASHGGAIGLLIALIFFSKKTKMDVVKALDYKDLIALFTNRRMMIDNFIGMITLLYN